MTVHRMICNYLVVSVRPKVFVGWELEVIIPPRWYAPWTWRKHTKMAFAGCGEDWDCVEINNVAIKPDARRGHRHMAGLNAIVSIYAMRWIRKEDRDIAAA